MSYVDVTDAAAVPEHGLTATTAAGLELVLVGHAGSVYALARRCPHMGGDLAAGALADGVLTCPRHGSRFDVTSGRCIDGPHVLFLKLPRKDVAAYPVRIEQGRIQVDVP